jgi:hypothetical protein
LLINNYLAVFLSNSGDLLVKAGRWADWLEARFVTVGVMKVGALPSSTPGALATVPLGSAQTTKAATKVTATPAQTPAATVAGNTSGYVPQKVIIGEQL